MERVLAGMDDIAFLRTGTTEFAYIRTDVGKLSASLADIRPYANGSRVTLRFGNPTSAILTGVTFKVDYGPLDKAGIIVTDSSQTQQHSLNGDLPRGSWKNEDVVLDGVPTSSLGYVRIHDIHIGGMKLLTP